MKTNKIDKLINEHCPDGVEFKELWEIYDFQYGEGNTIPTSGGKYPVYGSNGIVGTHSTYNSDNAPVIGHIGAYAGIVNWAKGKHFVTYNGIICKIKKDVNPKFGYYLLLLQDFRSKANSGSQPFVSYGMLNKIKIPLPPLPIQEEIVRILDNFTELEEELEAELEARKKQYEYYRNELLTFGDDVEWKTLNDVCIDIFAGGDRPKKYKKGQTEPSEEFPYPIFSNGKNEQALYGYSNDYKIDKEAVTISARGTIGFHTIRKPKFTPIVRLIVLISDKQQITTKFLNYVLDITEIAHSGGSIPQLTTPNVNKIRIPIPSISEQERIVKTLDKFDALVNDITIGLPAELEARRKQYEYYRKKLLTFKEVEG